eukprot:jgi/Bigna1/71461/fgenesh1_pg.15_\
MCQRPLVLLGVLGFLTVLYLFAGSSEYNAASDQCCDEPKTSLLLSQSLPQRSAEIYGKRGGRRRRLAWARLRGGSMRDGLLSGFINGAGVLAMDNCWKVEPEHHNDGTKRTVYRSPSNQTSATVQEMYNAIISAERKEDSTGSGAEDAVTSSLHYRRRSKGLGPMISAVGVSGGGRKRGRDACDDGRAGSDESAQLTQELATVSQELHAAMRNADRSAVRRLMQERDRIVKQLKEEEKKESEAKRSEVEGASTTTRKVMSKGATAASQRGRKKPAVSPSSSSAAAVANEASVSLNNENGEQVAGKEVQEEGKQEDHVNGGGTANKEEEEEEGGNKQQEASSTSRLKETGYLQLGNLRRITATEYRGNKGMDIREYYLKGGVEKPGVKGIMLTPEQWGKLMKGMKMLTTALEARRTREIGLGNMRFATTTSYKGRWFVDVREYWKNSNAVQGAEDGEEFGKSPGRKGIMLRPEEWNKLVEHSDQVDNELAAVITSLGDVK